MSYYHISYLQDLFNDESNDHSLLDFITLTEHVNATTASRICSEDERKKLIGPNAHALMIISSTK